MANDHNTPLPDDDLPDPVEAELVAFLDGELDPGAAHDVERKLATDPNLRARATALKKSFALLDFLPRTEPSPEFATRTLDKLPIAKSGTIAASGTRQPASPSSSLPIPLSNSAIPVTASSRGWTWLFGLAAAVVVALAGGYYGMAAARNYFHPPIKDLPTANSEGEVPPDRVARYLPLYAAADDLEFVVHLADDPILFDEESLASSGELRVPWVAEMANFTRAFQSMPAERQKQILKLDQQLHALDAKERDRLLRALEGYGSWLDRLPEAERRGVLSQATPSLRLKVIRDIRQNQAQEALPEIIRNDTDPANRAARLRRWEAEEADRKRAWSFAREHWDSVRGTRNPWPFENAELRKQVIDYAKAAYRFEDRKASRLQPQEAIRLAEAFNLGEKENSWLWFGWMLHDLTPRYDQREAILRYEMFPEPADGRFITDFAMLPNDLRLHYANKPKMKFDKVLGKWPDFALFVHDDITRGKFAVSASSLGPARIEDFAEPARGFVSRELVPVLTGTERYFLDRLEGRWPDYPRLLIRTARAHDLSIPGVMLPGKPSEWDRTYAIIPGRGMMKTKGNPLP